MVFKVDWNSDSEIGHLVSSRIKVCQVPKSPANVFCFSKRHIFLLLEFFVLCSSEAYITTNVSHVSNCILRIWTKSNMGEGSYHQRWEWRGKRKPCFNTNSLPDFNSSRCFKNLAGISCTLLQTHREVSKHVRSIFPAQLTFLWDFITD